MKANEPGFLLVVLAGFIVGVGYFVMGLPDVFVVSIAAGMLIVIDGMIRLKHRSILDWPLVPEAGGNFLLVPVWFLGAIVILLNQIPRQ